jgi:hypothetical protein
MGGSQQARQGREGQRALDDVAQLAHIARPSEVGSSSPESTSPHCRDAYDEQWIERSGLSFTFLRPGFFMSNALRWTRR